jgi:hypothetical protein
MNKEKKNKEIKEKKNVYSGYLPTLKSTFNWIICGVFFFLLLTCLSSLHILGIKVLSDKYFENISSYPVGCHFTLFS